MTAGESRWNCVVDASVAIKLFVVEPLTDKTDALFTHLSDTPPARFYVPELFFVECTHILWKYVRRHGYAVESARQDIADLVRLPLQAIPMSVLLAPAFELAVNYGSTAYDSAYVALAQKLQLPLVTADEVLVRQYAGTGLAVRSLGEFVG